MYLKPSMVVIITEMATMICGSKDITSNKGINYGGVDEEGTKDPSSRRQRDLWEEEEEKDY